MQTVREIRVWAALGDKIITGYKPLPEGWDRLTSGMKMQLARELGEEWARSMVIFGGEEVSIEVNDPPPAIYASRTAMAALAAKEETR